MKTLCCAFIAGLTVLASAIQAVEASKPNIIVIVAADLGYADVLFNAQHPKEANTPHPFLTSFSLYHLPEAAKWTPQARPDVQTQNNPNAE